MLSGRQLGFLLVYCDSLFIEFGSIEKWVALQSSSFTCIPVAFLFADPLFPFCRFQLTSIVIGGEQESAMVMETPIIKGA